MSDRIYICIDLKSFYASVECVRLNLDPLTTNLVVADESRSEKTVCLAITSSLKSFGIPSRARLFEVIQKVQEINKERRKKTLRYKFNGKSSNIIELNNNPNLELDFIIAPPRMAEYINISSKIYGIYLKYIAPEDIYVYSIDEVFMDVTSYVHSYKLSPHELAIKMIKEVLKETGITATAGIGCNMYLAKVAMDIVAKKMNADKDGVRIAELDEMSYRKELWNHRPLIDFWRIGRGYQNKLEANGIYTMGDIALCSIENEELLYNLFGVNAELLIDHAWSYEPCTIELVKNYKSKDKSLGSGQVLSSPYNFQKAKLVVKEMIDALALDLCDKELVTNQVVLTIDYDVENLKDKNIMAKYHGEITTDYLGRKIPKYAHGTICTEKYTSSSKILTKTVLELYDNIVNRDLLIKRINIVAKHILCEKEILEKKEYEQLDLFTDYEELNRKNMLEEKQLEKEKKSQKTIIAIKKKYGKNAIIKAMDLEDGATMKERNNQIGGHKA